MNVIAALAVGWVAATLTMVLMRRGAPIRTAALRARGGRLTDRLERQLSQLLAEAGSELRVAQFVVRCVGLCAAVGLVVAVLVGPLIALVPAIAVLYVPLSRLERRRRQRRAVIRASWPDALRDIGASLSAGLSMHQALIGVAAAGPVPLRPVFAEYGALSRSIDTGPALELVRAELADPVSDRVLEVLAFAAERGGLTVRAVIGDLIEAISDDLHVLDALESEVLESRINARAVVVLPWFALAMLTLSPGPFRAFYGSASGAVVIAVGAVMTGAGGWVVSRLARTPIEPRVLAGGDIR